MERGYYECTQSRNRAADWIKSTSQHKEELIDDSIGIGQDPWYHKLL